jgi:hypothetical protein
MFIPQTRLVRIEPRNEGARYNGIVRNLSSALLDLPSPPPANEWGNYMLVYDLRCALRIRALGVIDSGSGTMLVVVVNVWLTPASRVAGNPPVVQESFIFARPKATTGMQEYLRGAIRDFLIRASLQGLSGDLRDPRLNPRTTDGTGFFDDPDVVVHRNTTLDLDTTSGNSSPLRTNPETGQ